MVVHLPPAAALRAFEAAARHNSFTAAANELNITPSAVSHQLRHLEDLWQMPLFTRTRKLSLTFAGQQLAPIVRQFLNSLEDTLADLRSPDLVEPLRVSLTQSFAVKWLLPRLPEFSENTPNVNIWISTTDQLARFDVEDIDVAIRLGTGPYYPLHAEPLLREYIFPVASPKLIGQYGEVINTSDILRYPLILRSGNSAVPRWELWFEKLGFDYVVPSSGPRFPDTAMTIEAAVAGQGVALVRSAHITDELASGRLVKLSKMSVPSPLVYHFVCASGAEKRPKVAAFKSWILKHAAVAQALYDERDGGNSSD
ncbi:transcriptional regulator GcvA [Phyllobacterium endophyticum]|uniref:LysR family transcriptional regulator n=1 Tax=Phyllobacterium endophyticum TaxID=1149773 RepID=A0A2P7AR24_9HYPH|nr:transcriptional regulator GcvA [Phyllobacterium endophyticum]MBB3237228.1 LysR family glycine cleavage system transcriptional activator [Phyllobacterium endophyticum]PSH56607.1 LysR family transcriptional regulator [Phyllobacterium endophyticum]TYR44399.1 transcriptional regulator GcvA [Phyllobacterium endophyticum]